MLFTFYTCLAIIVIHAPSIINAEGVKHASNACRTSGETPKNSHLYSMNNSETPDIHDSQNQLEVIDFEAKALSPSRILLTWDIGRMPAQYKNTFRLYRNNKCIGNSKKFYFIDHFHNVNDENSENIIYQITGFDQNQIETGPLETTALRIPEGESVDTNLIPLTLREHYEILRLQAPVTSGVPLLDGSVKSVDQLRLLKKFGNRYLETPAQFKVLSRWNGECNDSNKYIKWVLVDFKADVPPGETINYFLHYGEKIVCSAKPAQPVHIDHSAESILINTGPAEFRISKTNFNLFESVKINGVEMVKTGPLSGGVIKDSYDSLYYGAKNVQKVVVEEEGPLRTGILVKGSHANLDGSDHQFYQYITRIHFFAGKSTVKVIHTLSNTPALPRDTPGRGALAFKDFSLVTPLDMNDGEKAYSVYGSNEIQGSIDENDELSIYQGSDGGKHWHSDVNDVYAQTRIKGYQIRVQNRVIDEGERALGLVQLSDTNQKGVSVAINGFWRLFPKKITFRGDGTLIIGLLPEEFTQDGIYYHWLEDMFQIRTELFYHFFTNRSFEDSQRQILDLVHPLFAASDPSWYSRASASSLPDGDIYFYETPIVAQALPEYKEEKRIHSVEDLRYPLVDPIQSLYSFREKHGLYSAYYYGPRREWDKNGRGFKHPVEHFINFMQTGYTGNTGDKYRYYLNSDLDDAIHRDYDFLWGGVEFTKHWMHNRATNLPEGWEREEYGINTRKDQTTYWFQSGYPRFGGRIGKDPIHTRKELKPIDTYKGDTQPARDWYFMDSSHVNLNHVLDYYHLTGDMFALDYAASAAELLENYLDEDLRSDGVLNDTEITDTSLRTEARPVLALAMMYEITGEDQYLRYARLGAERIMNEQNLAKGHHQANAKMSYTHYPIVTQAFAKLYELTSDEIYFDRINGYVNFLIYYLAAPNGYLNGKKMMDGNQKPMEYAESTEYYDSHRHQPENDLDGLASSNLRFYYPLSWLFRYTGDPKYLDLLNLNYDSKTNGQPVWRTDSPWMQTYLVERFLRPKKDRTPPPKITDLTVCAGDHTGEAVLEWTEPYDETGLSKYQVKYAPLPMVEQIVYPDELGKKMNFWAARNIDHEPKPGQTDNKRLSMTVNNLSPETTYYFCIRSFDLYNNRSELSNQPAFSIKNQ